MSPTMVRLQTKNTARKNHQRRKRCPNQRVCSFYFLAPLSFKLTTLNPVSRTPAPVLNRQADSDSDSDYGSRSKKKKKPRVADENIRMSSRGVKVPNYVDDVQNFEEFEEDEGAEYYVADPNSQYEDHEIEGVYYHMRDEDRKDDPEDLWHDNVVCIHNY